MRTSSQYKSGTQFHRLLDTQQSMMVPETKSLKKKNNTS